jgi:iron complex transport system substrate-binding protein
VRRAAPVLLLTLLLGLLTSCSEGAAPAAPPGATRTVEHALGTSVVPIEPQRVAVLDGDTTLQPLAALGIPVVAAASPDLTGEPLPAVRELIPDAVDLGPVESLSMEAVASARPDLIVLNPGDEQLVELADQLSAVAPVVAPEYEQTRWRERLQEVAEIFGREGAARELLAEHDRRVAEVDALVPDGTTLSVVRVRRDGFRYLTSGGSFPWTVLRELGFVQPPVQEQGTVGTPYVELSQEQTTLLAADLRVVAVDGVGDAVSTLDALQANPLWAGLGGRVEIVPADQWVFGSVLTAREVLDLVAFWYT